MKDSRFNDRISRIQSKHSKGFQPEVLAGVGEVNEAKKAAADGLRRPSLKLALVGVLIGLAAFALLNDIVGLREAAALAPNEMLAVAQSDPLVMFVSGLLVIFAFMGVIAILRGRKSVQMASFVWPAVLTAGAATAYVVG